MRAKPLKMLGAALLLAGCAGATTQTAPPVERPAPSPTVTAVSSPAVSPPTTPPPTPQTTPTPTPMGSPGAGQPTPTTAPDPAPATTREAAIVDYAFEPAVLEVAVGTRVVWTNTGSFPHTVTSGPVDDHDGLFDSDLLDSGQTFEVVFTQPGTYAYFCNLHPRMTATVEVAP